MRITNVPVTVHQRVCLSAPPYQLWVRGTLLEELGIRDDGSVRVEIIGGETVVSPGSVDHADVLGDMRNAMARACCDSDSPRQTAQNADCHFGKAEVLPLPSLVVLDEQIYREARKAEARFLVPRQMDPVAVGSGPWNGNVLVNVPCYLFVDLDSQRLVATFSAEPASGVATCVVSRFWEFAETFDSPESFAIEFPPEAWES